MLLAKFSSFWTKHGSALVNSQVKINWENRLGFVRTIFKLLTASRLATSRLGTRGWGLLFLAGNNFPLKDPDFDA